MTSQDEQLPDLTSTTWSCRNGLARVSHLVNFVAMNSRDDLSLGAYHDKQAGSRLARIHLVLSQRRRRNNTYSDLTATRCHAAAASRDLTATTWSCRNGIGGIKPTRISPRESCLVATSRGIKTARIHRVLSQRPRGIKTRSDPPGLVATISPG